MRLVHCGGPIGAGPPEIDGGEPWPYSIKILDCWFFGDRVYRLAVEGAPFPCLLLSLSERSSPSRVRYAAPTNRRALDCCSGRSEKRSQLRGNGARME